MSGVTATRWWGSWWTSSYCVMSAPVRGCRRGKKAGGGGPAWPAAGIVVSSRLSSRVSNGSPATSAMPHLRQRPASPAVTSGCIGQNHAVTSAGGVPPCCAAPSDSSATSSSASLLRRIVIQRNGERRGGGGRRRGIEVPDGLYHRTRGHRHGPCEDAPRLPVPPEVFHRQEHIAPGG